MGWTDIRIKTDLIEKALSNLAHQVCPHCQRDIRMSGYISRDVIEEWLLKKEVKK